MTQWHEFLASQGAVLSNSQVASFGNPQAEMAATANGNVLADLSHLGLLQLDGEDRVTFLQGQVTNDVKLLDGGHSQYAGYCSPKGRLLALFLAFSRHDSLYLQLHGELTEPIMKRLRMYVMRSKVVIANSSQSIICMGLAGKDAEATLNGVFGQAPKQAHALSSLENGTLIRMPGPDAIPCYQIFVTAESAADIWKELGASAAAVGKPCWDWLEIQAGVPEIGPATQEEFVPQMVNLDALEAINYKKGCYTGQEIVARTHYLGKIKRRTQLAHIAAEPAIAPQAGDDVFSAPDNAPIGKIVRGAPSPHGGFDVLAEIRLESLQSASVQWQGTDLQIQALPYSLDN
jgi:tRNA-modifying protein YgfZ